MYDAPINTIVFRICRTTVAIIIIKRTTVIIT